MAVTAMGVVVPKAALALEELDPKSVHSQIEQIPVPENEIETRDVISDKALETPEIIEDLEGPPARSVRIDLQKVEGAAFYEVHVVPAKKIWSEPLKFVVPHDAPTVRLRLSPGQYSVQTRSLDESKAPGRWSNPSKFWVQFRPIPHAFPAPGDEIAPKSNKKEALIFEWPTIDSAKFYFFRLKDESGKIIRMAITQKNYLKSEVNIGSRYSWSVLPMTRKEHYQMLFKQDAVAPYSPFSVLAPDEESRGTLVQIQRNPKAAKYQFEVVNIDAKDSASPPSIYDSYESGMRFRLAPGEYEVRVRSVYDDKTSTEWSAPKQLFVKRFVPTLESPGQNEEVDSVDKLQNPVSLEWKADPTAKSYRVFVFNSQNALVHQIAATKNQTTVELPHDETYHWTVRAFSAREPAQESVKPEEAEGTFQINRYIPLELGSGEEPSQYYGWVKQISSEENYYGENYENNAIITQKFFGGAAEGAVGYWNRKTRFGILAHGGLAGFLFRGKNYLYSDAGLHLGYRHLLDNGDRLRFWLGASYREMPEVITHPFTTEVEFNKIKSLGPQVQVVYAHSISEKTGLQVIGSVYQSLKDMGTPNGKDQKPKLSYNGSIFGTYVWSEPIRLMGGYTYRLEQAAYDSEDTPGQVNYSQISGHYLSFMIEFALDPAMK
jgi:hypothetical protein